MRTFLRSIFIVTALVAVVIVVLGYYYRSNSWTSGTTRGCAVDNVGFAILLDDTVRYLETNGFTRCPAPAISTPIPGIMRIGSEWRRSSVFPDVYCCTYSDSRYYSAYFFVTSRGAFKKTGRIRRYTEQTVNAVKDLWDRKRHLLPNS